MSAMRLESAFENPAEVLAVIRRAGPLWPLANYASNDAEMATLSTQAKAFTPPWFRQDFVRGGKALVDGAEVILDNARFRDAAQQIGGPDSVVVPHAVYVNIMGPTPFAFPPHLDVPAFRGITRLEYPIWFLKVMMSSGLFEPWRIKIATAVSWFYDGPGGDFHYWPQGIDGGSVVVESPFHNVAVVADNERTFHGVAPVGPPGSTMPEGIASDCRLVRGDGRWEIIDGAAANLGHIDDDIARVTISWKADLYEDAEDHARTVSGADALTLEAVIDRFCGDLTERGVGFRRPSEPLGDPEWTAVLAATYPEIAPAMP
ncbi:MAG: hypothetical protein GX868_00425 [Actinobacteria bacterium]|nr:hypothetical protein [Actinomycetota bacterium]